MFDWIFRFVKGIFIGSGFILPGISGGTLAAVFGVYERIITFLAHLNRNFKSNLLYMIPLGLGGITGVFLFSIAISFFLGNYETQILWLFIGCILGTLPALWKQAGEKGRTGIHIVALSISFLFSLTFMIYGERLFGGNMPQNFFTWLFAGSLIGLSALIPGLSSSNLLLYMGMFKDMTDGIKDGNLSVIIPILIGAALAVILFSKLMDLFFRKAHSGLFHIIVGIVGASTLMIIPRDFNYLSFGTIICIILCAIGMLFGYWMCSLEKKYG